MDVNMKDETTNSATNSERSVSISTKVNEAEPKPKLQEIFEEFGGADSFLKSGEGIDIYQLVAFQCKCRPQRKKIWENAKFVRIQNSKFYVYDPYYYNIFKAMVTLFVQIASVLVLLDYAFKTVKKESDKDFCDNSGNAAPKTMAISYTTFLSLILWSTVQQGKNSGFYRECNGQFDDEIQNSIFNIVDYTWITFGRTLCHGVILSAFTLSFLIIFYTTDPMDIILNAVALLFIADIDNMVVTPNDYEDMYQWFKDNKDDWEEYVGDGVLEEDETNKGCGWCCDLFCLIVRFFVGRFIKIAVNIFAFCMAITAPLLIFICY